MIDNNFIVCYNINIEDNKMEQNFYGKKIIIEFDNGMIIECISARQSWTEISRDIKKQIKMRQEENNPINIISIQIRD